MVTKAILIGNGMSSQLIEEYNDYKMIEKFKELQGAVYYEINNMLTPFRNLEINDEKHIIKLLEQMGIEYHHYHRYFVKQNLNRELNSENIIAIETLLKVAQLFNHVKEFPQDVIRKTANIIYYNKGENGINDINTLIDVDLFKKFINQFEFVFTTNFDNILDDVFCHEVYHLHGGFNYIREINGSTVSILKSKDHFSPEKAHLIWGKDAGQKEAATHGGAFFPMDFLMDFGGSILEGYYRKLQEGDYEELHIWGYSGENDGHINDKISENTHLTTIFYYVSPSKVTDESVVLNIYKMFNDKKNIVLKSWDDIWSSLK